MSAIPRGWPAAPRRALAAAVALLVLALLAACAGAAAPAGASGPGGASPTSRSLAVATTASPTPTTQPLPSGAHIGSNGQITYQPADNPQEAASPDPQFDFGYTVFITSSGMRPLSLLSGCCRAVTWKNMTGRTQSIVFDAQLTDSGPIAPGKAYAWTPQHPESITYHSAYDPTLTGQLTIQQMFES